MWANYRLVATQWPIPVGRHVIVGEQDRFPADAVTNPVMEPCNQLETYIQGASCLGCHNWSKPFRSVFYPKLRKAPLSELRGMVEQVQAQLKAGVNKKQNR